MSNMLDYLNWRGDLSLSKSTFNEVDNILMAYLAYTELEDFADWDWSKTIEEAWREYSQYRNERNIEIQDRAVVLEAMAKTKRFKSARISHVKSITDENTQFAAMTISLTNNIKYVSFRGTDDSLVGWQEDFELSYSVTKAQHLAAEYLDKLMSDDDCQYYVGGHSKGGNLAMYAALKLDDKKLARVKCVFSNDGPGFSRDMVSEEEISRIKPILKQYLPSFCVVGKIFAVDSYIRIVKSDANGMMQHNPLSWQLVGRRFEYAKHHQQESRIINETFDKWLLSTNMEEREQFTRELFLALESKGAKRLSDISDGGLSAIMGIAVNMAVTSSESKQVAGRFIDTMKENIKENASFMLNDLQASVRK